MKLRMRHLEAVLAPEWVVYRLFDEQQTLLYIGVTGSLKERFAAHKTTKRWWDDVFYVALQPFDNHQEAARAEEFAIFAENPLHNVRGKFYRNLPKSRNLALDLD